jgi:hypothetical protein
LDVIRQTICEFLRDELATYEVKDTNGVSRDFLVQHIVGAYIAVLAWWLEGGAKLPPQRIDAIFRRLTLQGLGLRSPT